MTNRRFKIKPFIIFVADLLAFSAGLVCIAVLYAIDADLSVYQLGFFVYFSTICACLFAVLVCVDFCAAVVIKTSTFHSSLMALSVLISCMLAPDYIAIFPLTETEWLNTLTVLLQYGIFIFFMLFVVFFFDFSYNLKMTRRRKSVYIIACIASAASFAALYFVKLQYIAFFLFMVVPIELTHYVSGNVDEGNFNLHSFRPTQILVFMICGFMAVNILCSSGFMQYPFGMTCLYLLAAALVYAFIYFNFIRLTQKRAFDNAVYRARYIDAKLEALQAQIKPHFVFNVLTSIKNLYHCDSESGDNAIDLFSRHLRARVVAANSDLIPFEKELDNVKIYIELENMRREKDLNVVFDIEYSDFLIPALSLQPFIENAIKYGRTDEKADGYIRLSSHSEEGGVLLEITDNGVGFDVASIPPSSCGIRNSVERFSLLTGLSPQVASTVGEGTSIKIFYDAETLERLNENNHC